MRIFHAVLALASLTFLSACGGTSSIDLKAPASPSIPPVEAGRKPTSPAGGTDASGGGSSPSTAGQNSSSNSSRYLLCIANGTGLGIMNADLGLGHMPLSPQLDDQLVDPASGRADHFFKFESPLGVQTSSDLKMGLFFVATRVIDNSKGRQMYYADLDLPLRRGLPIAMGRAVDPTPAASTLAARLGLQLHVYGGSSLGHYLLVPGSDGRLRLMARETLKTLAILPLSAERTFNANIDEAEGILSALIFNGSTFKPYLAKVVGLGTNSPTLDLIRSGGLVSSNTVLLQHLNSTEYVWAEYSPSAGGLLNFTIYNVNASASTHVAVEPAVMGTRVLPYVALLSQPSGVVAVVAEEPQGRVNGSGQLRMIGLTGASANAQLSSIDYPVDFSSLASAPTHEPSTVTALFSTEGFDTLYVQAPNDIGRMIYRWGLNGFTLVGEGSCHQPFVYETRVP